MSTITPVDGAAIAAAIGVNEQYLYQCLTRRRPTPAERCPEIERASAGRLVCEDMRPDVVWHRLPDPDWPWHPQGRPLIDVTRPPAAQLANQEARDAA